MSRSPLIAVVEDADAPTGPALLAAHAEQLADTVEAAGIEAAAEAAGLAPAEANAAASGDPEAAGRLDLHAVASVLALEDDAPSAEGMVDAALDDLLFGMTIGVLDVEAVAGELDLDIEPREVQGMLEGRHPLTLREFASIQAVIEGRTA